MGYMRHHTIIVCSWNEQLLASVHSEAVTIFDTQVSNIVKSKMNGYYSFFIAPDGSREGWEDSDEGDKKRNEFIGYLETQKYEDSSTPVAWVEIQFGDDEGETKIIRDSDLWKRENY